MSDGSQYDEGYFLRGIETGKSLYTNYRYLPDLTTLMVRTIIRHLGVNPQDKILDFGCARGYTVRAFRELGYEAWGYDISRWALDNADPLIKKHLFDDKFCLRAVRYNWVVAKDVLEHVSNLDETIDTIMSIARTGVFAVVPLAHHQYYDVPEYEKDVTHVHRHPLQWWVGYFHRPGWSVEGRYRVPGVKDNYAQHSTGNGFITARRIEE